MATLASSSTGRRRQNNGLVLPPDMERPVVLLADSIQRAMRALYNLHTALINSTRGSSMLVEQFRLSRNDFRAECDNLVAFLQECHGHAVDYASLCQFTLARPASERLAFAADISLGAQKIQAEAINIKNSHEKACKEFGRYKSKLISMFTQTSPPSTAARSSRGRREFSLDTSTSRFVEATHAALYPNGAEAVSATNLALRDMGVALRDIVAFWKDHAGHLSSIASQRAAVPQAEQGVQKSVETWSRYQSALLSAVSSISESSDAVMVDPVGAPSTPHDPSFFLAGHTSQPDSVRQERRKFWKRILDFLERATGLLSHSH